jgi:hypothetical protein
VKVQTALEIATDEERVGPMLLPGLAEPLGQEVHAALPVVQGLEVSPALLADCGTNEALGES